MPAEMHFLRPWVLLLLPVVWLGWYLLRRLSSTDAWQQLLAPHLYRQLLAQQSTQPQQRWLVPLMLLLGVLAGAGPSWQKLPQPAFQLKRATVLVLDMSMSMRATDIKPNRVTQARFKALDFAREQLEGEMALLAFAGDAYVISPLTPDHNNIGLLVPDLKPEIMPAQGSDFAGALKMADQLLQQAGYVRGDIVFFTDGFDSQQFMQIRDTLNGFAHRVSVLAFGTNDGAPIQLENGELLKDARGSIVLPKVPLSQLKEIATLTGGVFAASTFDDSDVQKLLALPALNISDSAEQTLMQGDQWQDAGVYLCYLLLLLALWYLRSPQLLLVPLLLLVWPQAVPAEQVTDTAGKTTPDSSAAPYGWQDLWQSKTAQAKQAYDNGDYGRARQQFSDPLWQGNAAYRAGDYAAAAQLYQQDQSGAGKFNLGNSLAMQQQYQQALAAYQQAQQQQPDLAGVKENIALMQKMLEQQQQSEQQQNGDPQQQDSEQNDAEQQNQSEQNQQNQQSQDQQQSSQEQSSQDEPQPTDEAKADPAQQKQQQLQQAEQQEQPAPADEQQKAIEQAWPNASAEESQQLENLLRKVQDEPSLLLKNKMLLEYQKRQQQAIPRGVQQEW